MIDKVHRRVGGMIVKAVLNSLNDTPDLQLGKVSFMGETHEDVERVQNYGFTSIPSGEGQAIVLFIGGNRENPVIIACDDGLTRIKLEKGEVAIYNDKGAVVKLAKSGNIELGDGGVYTPLDGVVTRSCVCAFTGAPHPDSSAKVFARK